MRRSRRDPKRASALSAILLITLMLMLCACQQSSAPDKISDEKGTTEQIDAAEVTDAAELTPVKVQRNEEDDLVIGLTCEELIQRWNTVCLKNDLGSSLPGAEKIESYEMDRGIHTDHRARCYAYAPGDKHFYPALDIYTSGKDGKLIQINISYNEHDYRENTWKLHEEMCFAALGALMTDLREEDLEELCQKVYKEAADNMFPHEQRYGRGAVPAVLFHHNGIGVYPYFTEGSRDYFCVIPVDEESLSEFEESGTVIHPIRKK